MLRWQEDKMNTFDSFNKTGNRIVLWIYIAFIMGLISRILEIKPVKIVAVGVEFSVGNVDVVPGFFFCATLALTTGLFVFMAFFGFLYKTNIKSTLRVFLYRVALTTKKTGDKSVHFYTFKGKNPQFLKAMARILWNLYAFSILLTVLFPFVFVLLIERDSVHAAFVKLTH